MNPQAKKYVFDGLENCHGAGVGNISARISDIYFRARQGLLYNPEHLNQYDFYSLLCDGVHELTILRHQAHPEYELEYGKLDPFEAIFYEVYPLMFCADVDNGPFSRKSYISSGIIKDLRSFAAVMEHLKLDENFRAWNLNYQKNLDGHVIPESQIASEILASISIIGYYQCAFRCQTNVAGYINNCMEIFKGWGFAFSGFRHICYGVINLRTPNAIFDGFEICNYSNESNQYLEPWMATTFRNAEREIDRVILVDKRQPVSPIPEINPLAITVALSFIRREKSVVRSYICWQSYLDGNSSWMDRNTGLHPVKEVTTEEFKTAIGSAIRNESLIMEHEYLFRKYSDAIIGRNGPMSALVDAITCFEVLLSDGAEISRTIAFCIARLIGKDVHERENIYQDMKDIYAQRNFIIHGNRKKIAPPEKLIQMTDLCLYYLSFTLQHLIEDPRKLLGKHGSQLVKEIVLS